MRIKEILALEGDGRQVTVEGWVRTKRDSKGVSFIAVNDGSCMANSGCPGKKFPGI